VTDAAQWTSSTNFNADAVPVIVAGVAKVQANAAISATADGLVTAVAASARNSGQTPFTNNFDMLLPVDPRFTLTYNLCMIGGLAITPQTTGANVEYFPLGFLLQEATAQYDIILVDLDGCPRVLWA